MTTVTFPVPPEPAEPLAYPLAMASSAQRAGDGDAVEGVTIFSSLERLLPLYELAGWIDPKARESALQEANESNKAAAALQADFPDAASALRLWPLFEKFFDSEKKMIAGHAENYCFTTKFTYPSPKGERCVTRSRVEGDAKAVFAKPVHASSAAGSGGGGGALAAASVTNSTALFSLLPGHDHFLVYYERDKLSMRQQRPAAEPASHGGSDRPSRPPATVTVNTDECVFGYFTYLQLDALRFGFAAVKDLLDDSKTFNLNDGSLSLLARRDIKKNSLSSSFCLLPQATAAAPSASAAAAAAAAAGAASTGRATNVITGPKKEVVEQRREIAQKRFLKTDLEEECLRRWPYAPVAKSCVFVFEETAEADLTPEEISAMGLDAKRISANKNKNKRGQKFYRGVVELPMLHKKGGTARFPATRLWSMKKDAESAAAEAALAALRNIK